ncbi:MAG TPA: hypothetical protein VM290_01960 [Gaiellaceae bacterium]|nr:hypothetical protein [Gaiellaceae bacterium]
MRSLERRARNEEMFRAVNERLQALNEAFEAIGGEPPAFICECDDLHCTEQVFVGVADFERIRGDDRRYVLKPGHEAAIHYERVVERQEEYVVVEKPLEPGVSAAG